MGEGYSKGIINPGVEVTRTCITCQQPFQGTQGYKDIKGMSDRQQCKTCYDKEQKEMMQAAMETFKGMEKKAKEAEGKKD